MKFSDVIGNAEVKAALVRMADSGRIPHAMMFHENEGCGALALIVAFMQYLNCHSRHDNDSCGVCPSCNQTGKLIYPDLHFVFPVAGEKVTSSDFIRKWRDLFVRNPFFMENELYEALEIEKKASSFADGYRAVVIWLPEKMNQEAANRLLKIVEEPSEKTLFLFVTHQPERVLKTIRSRCQLIRVMPATREEIAGALPRWAGIDPETAGYAAEFASGSIGNAIRSLAERDDNVGMMDMFMQLMDGIIDRNYLAVLETGEAIAALDSREKQKAFCKFAGDCVRKIYMLQQNMTDIAGIRPEDKDFYAEAARKCGPEFCRRALMIITKAHSLVVRNVNQKIVFTNMVNRLFVNI